MIEQYSKTLLEIVESDPEFLDSIGFDLGKDEYNTRMKNTFYNMYMNEEINFINEDTFKAHIKALAYRYNEYYSSILKHMESAYEEIYKDYSSESTQETGERVSRAKSNSRPLSGDLSSLDNVADYMSYNKDDAVTSKATASGSNAPAFRRLAEFKDLYIDLYNEFALRFNIYFSEVYWW